LPYADAEGTNNRKQGQFFFDFTAARNFNRSAFSRIKPVASLWSYTDVSPSIVATGPRSLIAHHSSFTHHSSLNGRWLCVQRQE
jgi:hypothetical protein